MTKTDAIKWPMLDSDRLPVSVMRGALLRLALVLERVPSQDYPNRDADAREIESLANAVQAAAVAMTAGRAAQDA